MKRTALILATVAALGTAAVSAPAEARGWNRGWGPGIGFGLAAGALAAGAFAASQPYYYDGYYARKLNAVTNLGKFFDPVADKILVSSLLILLMMRMKVDPAMVILFVTRDTIVGGVRAAAAADGLVIDAQSTGKWKAALQMIAIPMLLLNDLHPMFPNTKIGYGLLWLSVILSLQSGYNYCAAYFRSARGQ